MHLNDALCHLVQRPTFYTNPASKKQNEDNILVKDNHKHRNLSIGNKCAGIVTYTIDEKRRLTLSMKKTLKVSECHSLCDKIHI